MLLIDAMARLCSIEAAARMIVVDPIDENAGTFYGRYGVVPNGRERHDSDVGLQSAAATNFCVRVAIESASGQTKRPQRRTTLRPLVSELRLVG